MVGRVVVVSVECGRDDGGERERRREKGKSVLEGKRMMGGEKGRGVRDSLCTV